MLLGKLLKSNAAQSLACVPELSNAPINSLTTDDSVVCVLNRKGSTRMPVQLMGAICRATLEYVKGDDSSICLTKISDGHYAAEAQAGGDTLICDMLFKEGECKDTKACLVSPAGAYNAIQNIGASKSDKTDTSAFMLIYLHAIKDLASSTTASIEHQILASEMTKDLSELTTLKYAGELYDEDGKISEKALPYIYRINDAVTACNLEGNKMQAQINASGNLSMLKKAEVVNLRGGTILNGKANYLAEDRNDATIAKVIPKTLGALKKHIADVWHPAKRKWTKEQEALICTGHGDDWPISDALFDIINMYYSTKNSEHPMLNISYRGPTGVGKSEDMKVMSEVLNMPLYIITCCSTTRTEDFMSKQVPNTTVEEAVAELPSCDDMQLFPEDCYETITGKKKDDATPEDCVQALLQRGAASDSGFIITHAAYLLGLMGGALVEVQEASRIKDASTLVGLNEFCRQKAVIPLADGRTTERNPDALVCWTDNYGYDSCRKKEASVKRRFDADIIAPELKDDEIIARIKKGFKPAEGFDDTRAIPAMLEVWRGIRKYSSDEDLGEEVPWTDLRNWVYLLNLQGEYRGFTHETIVKTLREAVLNKFIEDADTEKEVSEIITNISPFISKVAAICGDTSDTTLI